MKIYTRKRQWKWILFVMAVIIVTASLYYTNTLVKKISDGERERVRIWADAIQRKADLVNYTNEFFKQIRNEERTRVELWAMGFKYLLNADLEEDITFYTEVTSRNTTIPVIVTDQNREVKFVRNVDFNRDTVSVLRGSLLQEFSVFEPLYNTSFGQVTHVYYKESKLYTELRRRLDDLIESFFSDVANNSISVPVIVTDTVGNIILSGNIDSLLAGDEAYMTQLVDEMASENTPIRVRIAGKEQVIYYKESYLLTQLRYYPFAQFAVIGLFLLVSYLLFSVSRRAEQNQVWVGMAKETAHQLGTPLSSLMAWQEILEMKNIDKETLTEMSKDISRLETITDRFSKIGAEPKLQAEAIVSVLEDSLNYMKHRSSDKIRYSLTVGDAKLLVPLNKPLFQWVVENLLKNSVDAMNGEGAIGITVEELPEQVIIDVSDDGKGIPKSKHKSIFHPGYTTKHRGWGLGLTLSKRIIEIYHKGKIFVRQSSTGKGTTFRIILRKE